MSYARRTSVYRFESETLDFKGLIASEEGTISAASLRSVDQFVKTCKNFNVWDKLEDVGLFVGDQLAAALCKIKAGGGVTIINDGYIEGLYDEGVGIMASEDGFLDTDVVINDVLGTRESGGLVVYAMQGVAEAGGTLIGNAQTRLSSDGAEMTFDWGGETVFTSVGAGFYSGQIEAGQQLSRRYFNNALDNQPGGDTAQATDDSLYLLAKNQAGVADRYSGILGFYAVTRGLNVTESNSLYVAVQALQVALGRSV
ncbi:MAG TPA: hypothetical protein VK530_17810 [Candidatus Acidoferrum sp.]|nr:hypothetical protein [Candidatus Acidoferrum sp.]